MTQIPTEKFVRMIMTDLLIAMREAAPVAPGVTAEKLNFHFQVLAECETCIPALAKMTVNQLQKCGLEVSDRIA